MKKQKNHWILLMTIYGVLIVSGVLSLAHLNDTNDQSWAEVNGSSWVPESEWSTAIVWVSDLMIHFIDLLAFIF